MRYIRTEHYYYFIIDVAASCEYGEHTDEHIRDQIVDKCTSSSLRQRLLRTENLKLKNLLAMARAGESADRQAAVMEGGTSASAFKSPSDVNVIDSRSNVNARVNTSLCISGRFGVEIIMLSR